MKLYKKTVSLMVVFALIVLTASLSVNSLNIDGKPDSGEYEPTATYSGFASETGKSIKWSYYEKAILDKETKEIKKPANSLFFNYVGNVSNADVGTCRIIKDSYSPDTPTLDIPDWQHWDETGVDISYSSVFFTSGIKTIGHGTCYNAAQLETVTIGWSGTATTSNLKEILSYAFDGCTAIKTINFEGTKAQWTAIEKGEHNGVINYTFDEMKAAGITFNDKCALNGGHKPAKTWNSDETGHWHACTVCGEKCDFASHTLEKNKCTVCEYESDTLLGDFDNDGELTQTDADMLAAHLVGKTPLSQEQLDIADVNADGKIDVSDCVSIKLAAKTAQE